MEERTKLIWTVIVFLVVLGVEIFFLIDKYDQTKTVQSEIEMLRRKNDDLLKDIRQIPGMQEELAKLTRNDAILAKMVTDGKEDFGVIDFIGHAQDTTGLVVESYKEKEKRGVGRGPEVKKDYEVHSWEVKLTGTCEQFTSFINQFEYHGFMDDYMRLFSIPTFTVRQTAEDSLVNDCIVQVDAYSMKSAEGSNKTKAK
ncbi:MAG: hypothetical protein V2A58_07660 [Planctomycetota bacterium]